MIVYLAGRFSDRFWLRIRRDEINALPEMVVTSRWLDRDIIRPADETWGLTGYAVRCAKQDLEDVADSDLLIISTETSDPATRGGRYVEMGYALAVGLEVWHIGPRTNVFTYLPEVRHFDSWEEILDELGGDDGGADTVMALVA